MFCIKNYLYNIFYCIAFSLGKFYRISKIKKGKGSRIYFNTFVKYPKHIIIGENSFINYNCILWAAPNAKIQIGSDVIFGPNVTIIASNHGTSRESLIRLNEWIDKDIIIGDDVWLGANTTILAGVEIGDGCVIAANSVVNKNLKPYSINGGIPCKFIKDRV